MALIESYTRNVKRRIVERREKPQNTKEYRINEIIKKSIHKYNISHTYWENSSLEEENLSLSDFDVKVSFLHVFFYLMITTFVCDVKIN